MDNITWKVLNLSNQNPCDKRILDRPLRKVETAKEESCICKKAYDGLVQSYGVHFKQIAQSVKSSGKFEFNLNKIWIKFRSCLKGTIYGQKSLKFRRKPNLG